MSRASRLWLAKVLTNLPGSPDELAANASARELSLAAPVPAGDQGLGQPGKT